MQKNWRWGPPGTHAKKIGDSCDANPTSRVDANPRRAASKRILPAAPTGRAAANPTGRVDANPRGAASTRILPAAATTNHKPCMYVCQNTMSHHVNTTKTSNNDHVWPSLGIASEPRCPHCIYTYIYTETHLYIYTYIYRYRCRYRQRHIYINMYIFIYMYIILLHRRHRQTCQNANCQIATLVSPKQRQKGDSR